MQLHYKPLYLFARVRELLKNEQDPSVSQEITMSGSTNDTAIFILRDYYQEAADHYGFSGAASPESGYALTINYFKQHYPRSWTKLNIMLLDAQLPGFVGGYPSSTVKEVGVDAVMIVLMALVFCLYLVQFIRNQQVGHVFRPSLLVLAHCVLAMVGWGCRIGWSRDFADFHLGVASYILITLTEYLLPLANFIFAYNVYDFMHPKPRKLVSWHKIGPVLGLVSFIICIITPSLRYYHYFDSSTLQSLKQAELAGAIMGLIFHLAPISLTIAAFASKTPEPDSYELVSQAYWIDSFGPFDRFRPQPIADGVTKTALPMRRLPGRGKYRMAHPSMHNGPGLRMIIPLFIFSALLLWSCTLMRTLSIGYANSGYSAMYLVSSDPYIVENVWFPSTIEALWVFYGGVQTFTLLLWFFMRVDLRFYAPPNTQLQYELEMAEKKSDISV